ncbi:nitroreductase family protein [Enterococcus sp. C76]|uniref:nitroreductase family protein n=1 Tax=Enterococcus sp. C76 TaxID=3231334 RepID=UPI0034A01025
MHCSIKEFFPYFFLEKLKKVRNVVRSFTLFKMDKKRFLKNFSRNSSSDKEKLKARLLFFSHSIEKGLSREKIRYGFGKKVLPELYRLVKLYHKLDYDLDDSVYLNSLSILNQYICVHQLQQFDISKIINVKEFNDIYWLDDNGTGGVKYILGDHLQKNNFKNFKELALNRSSVRDYCDSEVDLQKINEAIEIATKSPSVCNRQSARIRVIRNKSLIEKALKVQGGFNGYNLPPCLLLITTDTRYFIDVLERNQVYIDGGIFAMSLLYALEYENLAACALNTMFDPKREIVTRKLLNIENYENLIMYISVGNFKKQYRVPKSYRLKSNQITKYF